MCLSKNNPTANRAGVAGRPRSEKLTAYFEAEMDKSAKEKKNNKKSLTKLKKR